MKPLNTQDRMKQFFIFLAFFIVTVILVTAVVYFDFSNPKEHNRLLIEENASLKKQIEANQLYVSQADSVLSKITQLNISNPTGMDTRYGIANQKMLLLKDEVESNSLLKNGIYSRFSLMTTTFLDCMKPINLPRQKQMNLI
ncbi:MAG: hypothetical protein IPL69_20395 [Saprospiraceae bacterium]|nr:hypothetical protein [Candidatus Brachybacter algidus]